MASPPATASPRLTGWAVCGALFTGTILLFSRAAGYGFTNYDDPTFVTENPHVRAGVTAKGIAWAFTGRADYWHPLTWMSHMLDWQLYGEKAAGHHMTSVLWHAVNAVLAFLVMRRLTGAFWTSAWGAALFAWHPLRVESVSWVAERKDVMSGFFFLATLWAYAAYAGRRDLRRRAWPLYALALLLFLGGLMCKPMLVTLPLLLLALDFWPLRRGGSWPALVAEKVPFLILSAVISAITVVMQAESAAFTLKLPFGARAGNAFVSLVRYAGKFLWPFDLTVIYPHPGYWPAALVAAAVLLVAAATAVAWRQRRARPWILTGWLWFLVMVLPAIGLVQVGFQAMADRYNYLPILGLQLALLWTLREASFVRAHGRASAAAAVLVLAACAARTWNQEATWGDSVTLYRHAIGVTRRNDTAHALLGYTLAGMGRIDEAGDESRLALAINPRNEAALITLAAVEERRGRLEDAAADCRAILQVDPGKADIRFSLGLLLLRLEHVPEATASLRGAVASDPGLAAKNLRDAAAEMHDGLPKDAFFRYAAAVAINPQDADAYVGFGLVLDRLGRARESLASLRRATQLDSSNASAHRALADALAQGGRFAEALPEYARAVELRPADASGHAAYGFALILADRRGEGISQWEEALRLDPKFPGLAERLRKIRQDASPDK